MKLAIDVQSFATFSNTVYMFTAVCVQSCFNGAIILSIFIPTGYGLDVVALKIIQAASFL